MNFIELLPYILGIIIAIIITMSINIYFIKDDIKDCKRSISWFENVLWSESNK